MSTATSANTRNNHTIFKQSTNLHITAWPCTKISDSETIPPIPFSTIQTQEEKSPKIIKPKEYTPIYSNQEILKEILKHGTFTPNAKSTLENTPGVDRNCENIYWNNLPQIAKIKETMMKRKRPVGAAVSTIVQDSKNLHECNNKCSCKIKKEHEEFCKNYNISPIHSESTPKVSHPNPSKFASRLSRARHTVAEINNSPKTKIQSPVKVLCIQTGSTPVERSKSVNTSQNSRNDKSIKKLGNVSIKRQLLTENAPTPNRKNSRKLVFSSSSPSRKMKPRSPNKKTIQMEKNLMKLINKCKIEENYEHNFAEYFFQISKVLKK